MVNQLDNLQKRPRGRPFSKTTKHRNYCAHGHSKQYCKKCNGSGYCVHGKNKSLCKDCKFVGVGGGGLCHHDKVRGKCGKCKKGKNNISVKVSTASQIISPKKYYANSEYQKMLDLESIKTKNIGSIKEEYIEREHIFDLFIEASLA